MNKKILLVVLILLVLCAVLVFLGLRQDTVPAGGDGGEEVQSV